jgi:hypothetical protein
MGSALGLHVCGESFPIVGKYPAKSTSLLSSQIIASGPGACALCNDKWGGVIR